MAEELRKKKVDVCGDKRYNGGAKELSLLELKEEDTSYGGQEIILEKVVLEYWSRSESVAKIQRSDRMVTMCLIFGEKMIQVICVYAPQSGKPDIQKENFYDELVYE